MSISFFFEQLIINFKSILKGIKLDTSLFWMIIPLLSIWLVLEIYFSRYKKEELGWNSSLANAISLIWVILPALRNIIVRDLPLNRYVLIIISIIYAIFIIYLSFTHSISSKIVYKLSDPSPIYFLGIIIVLWSYIPTLPWNIYIIIDLVFIFTFISILFKVINMLIPSSDKDDQTTNQDDSLFADIKEEKEKEKLNFNDDNELVDSFIEKPQNQIFEKNIVDNNIISNNVNRNNINSNNINRNNVNNNVSNNSFTNSLSDISTDFTQNKNSQLESQMQLSNNNNNNSNNSINNNSNIQNINKMREKEKKMYKKNNNSFVKKSMNERKHKGLNHKIYIANNPNYQKEFQENVNQGEYKEKYDHYFEKYNQ